jgi:membrane associated rhomboid family serine protease
VIPLKDVNPTRRPAVLTIGLIVACTLVFLFQTTKPDDLSLEGRQAFICEYGLVADHLIEGGGDPRADACQRLNEEHDRFLGLFTSQFLHGDWLHLIFNMLFLWVFGNNIEDRLGRLRYLPFFLVCGALAGLAQSAADPDSAVPLIGASGAISGVLGAYLVLYPRVGVWTIVLPFFFLPFRLPAWLWLAIYLALQVLFLGDSAGGGDVAYLAHIGGFVAGAVLIKPFLIGRDEPPPPSPAVGPVY